MTYLLTAILALFAGALISAGVVRRRSRGTRVTAETLGEMYLPTLRKIDKLILSNVSLATIAQQITDVVSDSDPFLGSMLRSIDARSGNLTVLAVSRKLHTQTASESLHTLTNRTVTPVEMQVNRSLTGQAVNERRMIIGEHLRDFECPLLSTIEADRLQATLGIMAIVVYPIVVEDRLSGAFTFYFDRRASSITDKDHALMQALADEAGIAMENTRLMHQLEDMNSKLGEANLHLQTLDATKDEFISITSHQLRSPLTAIKGYLSMLLDKDFGPVPKSQQPILRQIAQSTTEMINVLNDLLSVSKINAENFELTRAPVNLEDIVCDVVSELRPLAQEKSLELKVALPRRPIGVVYIDPLRIRQVIINFIDNAVKYTPQGTVEVKLTATAAEIRCVVKDNGIGIPRRELSQMFTKFYRAVNARKVVTLGTGLGLFVAKRVIEDHHGSVIMKSTEGKGSTFGFSLPRNALSKPAALEAPPEEIGQTAL